MIDPEMRDIIETFSEDRTHWVWLIFIFHSNTNQHKETFRPKIRPPRLGGKAMVGAFATRTPHRPNHIGLSLCGLRKIELISSFTSPSSPLSTQSTPHIPLSIESISLRFHLCGVDLVDGTPILAIYPYLSLSRQYYHPFSRYDTIRKGPDQQQENQDSEDVNNKKEVFRVPVWLQEPIETQKVIWSSKAEQTIDQHWPTKRQQETGNEGEKRTTTQVIVPKFSLYESAEDLKAFITQTLSYDIRAARHKGKGIGNSETLSYRVYLDTIDVQWTVLPEKTVIIDEIEILEEPGATPLNPQTLQFQSTIDIIR